MRVFVYWNIRLRVFSIAESVNGRRGKLIRHADSVALADAVFVVNENGRLRSVAKFKEVHAGIVGTLVDHVDATAMRAVTYNPHKAATFTRRDNGAPVHAAPFVHATVTVDKRADVRAAL